MSDLDDFLMGIQQGKPEVYCAFGDSTNNTRYLPCIQSVYKSLIPSEDITLAQKIGASVWAAATATAAPPPAALNPLLPAGVDAVAAAAAGGAAAVVPKRIGRCWGCLSRSSS
jgi:hypothetical protein